MAHRVQITVTLQQQNTLQRKQTRTVKGECSHRFKASVQKYKQEKQKTSRTMEREIVQLQQFEQFA